ncbi:response regulator [Marinomonas posidonica]|uniref:response regulator n=1 Tax=Marinomonas posidonica TaxID=936476 RepID=UPI0011811235|nr:response regulator [Marinomonas posidonica]
MSDVTMLGADSNNGIHQEIMDLSKKRVLIIEDIGEMRIMLKSLMSSLGYSKIDVEYSGQMAIKRILEKHYDVILSDFNLGGSVDGQQILETSRKNYAQDHSTIFIMITADTAYESVVSVLEYQPDSYLVKPFPPAAFFRRLEKVQKQKKIFEGINTARKLNEHEKMEAQAKAIMADYPHFANQCLKIIGESLYARGRYKDAKSHYMLIIQNHKNLAWAHFGIAQCEMKLGAVGAAIDKLEQTVELSRHFLSAYDLLAEAHEEQGNLEKAQSTIKRALEVSPRSNERCLRLAELSVKITDWETAEHAYSRIIRLTRDTINEKVEYYYEYLKCLTSMMNVVGDSAKLADKFKRSLIRLRSFGKANPTAISNSFRIEIQQYLAREHTGEAIKAWHQWNRLIESGQASPLTEAQEHTLKKRLDLL